MNFEETQNNDVFVGRQPLLTADMKTYAYELLFRSSRENWADFDDGDRATAQVLLNAFTEIGLERVVGNLPAFIKVPKQFLLDGHCRALPKDRVVLAMLNDINVESKVLAEVSRLREEGFTIALDDFINAPNLRPLVEMADVIKVNLHLIPQGYWEAHVNKLRKFDVKLVAEKVETQEEFELCRKMGFDYFQGFLFCHPTIVEGKKVPSHQISMLRLIAKLQEPDVGLEEVSEIVQVEPSIALQLLKYVNSAVAGLASPIESIRQAVTMTGLNRIRALASLSVIAEVSGEKPAELVRTVLLRARMSELLAIATGRDNTESYFLTGMFSALDVLMGLTMKEALQLVPLAPEVGEAILHRTGELGEVLECVLNYEEWKFDKVHLDGVDECAIQDTWFEASDWVQSLLNA